ncbi:MAG TPA: sigma-70 family RNA polymerase sigma factor [Actinomycetota bacterium]|nr:sigma-70 family RNA polymerase sigma factor [Actinomycetota bacterium]
MSTDPEDVELILRSRQEPELFGLLFERHAEPMLAFFARRTLDPEAAAELVAETFAEAFSSRARFRDQGVDGAAWLFGIGRNLLSRYFRNGAVEARARRRLGMPERTVGEGDYERIEELIDLEEVGSEVRAALSDLPEDQREAVTLRVIDGRPYHEVAEELGCTETTARARVSRSLRRIAARLEAEREETPIELERQRWKRRSTT